MKSSYNTGEVTLLLKDLTGLVEPVSMEERARRVAEGEHPRSIVIKEYHMTDTYRDIVTAHIPEFAKQTAKLVGKLAEKLYAIKGDKLVLVNIVRAGIPIGILVKRYLKKYYNVNIPHYGVSLVKGLDRDAMRYIISKHGTDGIIFIDGWTGKGTVAKEIFQSAKELNLNGDLAVLSDAIGVARYTATTEDVYIPNSPLNASITGLVSITVLNENFKGKGDFHGAVYLSELEEIDQSQEFVDLISVNFEKESLETSGIYHASDKTIDEISTILNRDKKLLNPGINEAARAVLRRGLEMLIVSDKNDPNVKTLIELAQIKNIPIVENKEILGEGYKAVSVANDNYIR